jgi:hypothetical protein
VVGGFVQQQQLGFGHQGTRQGHALFGAARKLGHAGLRRQVQALQGFFDALLPGPAAQGFQAGLQGVEVFAGCVGLEAVAQGARLRHTFGHGFKHGGGLGKAGFLRHVHTPQAALQLQLAVIGQLQARQDLQQRRLARAVAADEGHALAGFQRQAGAVEQGHVAVGEVGVLKGQQCHAFSLRALLRPRRGLRPGATTGRRAGVRARCSCPRT